MLQICMKAHPKSKSVQGHSKLEANRHTRTVSRAKNLRHPEAPGSSTEVAPRFHPARGLLVCLGWLRLFQAIVSDGIQSTRKPRFARSIES
jgi:hypothetical protein